MHCLKPKNQFNCCSLVRIIPTVDRIKHFNVWFASTADNLSVLYFSNISLTPTDDFV